MNNERIKAKEYLENGNYNEAIRLYSLIWNGNKVKIDQWLGWEYTCALKKVGRIDDAIKICRIIYQTNSEFRYNNHQYSWCLYEKYFKNINLKDKTQDINKLIDVASFIIKITEQNDKLPYEKTIWKIIKLHKEPFDAKVINEWLKKLDVNKLTDKTTMVVKDGRNISLASSKEEWFYLTSKCLRELRSYEECIKTCDLALHSINEFHNNRDIWMQVEKAECIYKLGQVEEAVNLLNELTLKKEHWVIHNTLFQIQVELGNIEEGLVNAYTAALSKDLAKGKVNMFFKIGNVLEKQKNYKAALMHYLFTRQIRNENKWKIPTELETCIERLSVYEEIELGNLLKDLNKFWTDNKLSKARRFEGCVLSIMPNNKAGFIKLENDNYYFKVISILDSRSKLKVGAKVSFSITESFDKKKNKASKEARDILFVN